MRSTSAEFRFMDLLWDREPVSSGELVAVCDQKFGWKKSTTYTFIKRLQEKGVIANEKSIVRALYKRDECEREESGEVVDQVFKGCLLYTSGWSSGSLNRRQPRWIPSAVRPSVQKP